MFSVVILSKDIHNLVPCVRAILANEPEMEDQRIVVVDDGAYTDAPRSLHGHTWVPGKKPFIFARNANIGLRKAYESSDAAILLNDDAVLRTHGGFTSLYGAWKACLPQYGLLSAATNRVGNTNQYSQDAKVIRPESRMLCFICCLIPRAVFQKAGPLDERYCLDYGVEDGDYSFRVRREGYGLGIWDQCFVDHSSLKSSYRGDGNASFAQNAALFAAKWGMPYGTE